MKDTAFGLKSKITDNSLNDRKDRSVASLDIDMPSRMLKTG
jgi:hypothetical protein